MSADAFDPHKPSAHAVPAADLVKHKVSYQPTEGLSYDPEEPRYWDAGLLRQEIDRVFEVCHGCRMCFKYCDSFPKLFDLVDNHHAGKVKDLTEADVGGVMDACFQCKLCEVQCPYTPRDKHEFQLDFPKLVHRFKAVRHKRQGPSLRERVLGDPDGAAKLARSSLGLANALSRNAAHRWFMERVLGVDRRKLLPNFAARTFESWADKQGLIRAEPGGEAVLFQTCYVQHNEPQIGQDTIEVLQRNQVDVRCASHLVCCGMPAWESGNLVELQRRAKINLDRLEPFVDRGAKVLAINPTCSMMLRREYPELLPPAERERAKKVAAAVQDPSEFVWNLRKEARFNSQFGAVPAQVSYHAPCHLRAQAVGFKGRDLIRKAGAQITTTQECCGHDGTYAMTVEGFEPSARIGQKAFDGVKGEGQTAEWVTDCPLAALQFEQHAGQKPLHPMSLLARSYRAGAAQSANAAGAGQGANAVQQSALQQKAES
jgi:glycerol-3-phosphate dehydrogenase subunit C